MMTEIAQLVTFRSKMNAVLFLILFALSAWLVTQESALSRQWWTLGWTALSVMSLAAWVASLGVSRRWRFQKISMKFRTGVVIKITYWLAGLQAAFSAVFSYLLFVELRDFNWNAALHFGASLIVLIVCMSIRYAIVDDMEKRKVCEFC